MNASGSRPARPPRARPAHWPPFCTNPRTNSSALDSRTPSISSSMVSMSSSRASLRALASGATGAPAPARAPLHAAAGGCAPALPCSNLTRCRRRAHRSRVIDVRTPVEDRADVRLVPRPARASARAGGPAGPARRRSPSPTTRPRSGVGHLPQAGAPEPGPGVLRRLVHRRPTAASSTSISSGPRSASRWASPFSGRTSDHWMSTASQPRVAPAQAVPLAVALEHRELGHPVELRGAASIGSRLEAVEHVPHSA